MASPISDLIKRLNNPNFRSVPKTRKRKKVKSKRYLRRSDERRLTMLKKKRSIMTGESYTKDIFLTSTEFSEFVSNMIFSKRLEKELETFHDSLSVHATSVEWNEFIKTEFQNLRRFQTDKTYATFFDDESLSNIHYQIHSSHVSVDMTGDEFFIERISELIQSKFELVLNEIEWIYSNDGASIEIPLRNDRMPLNEMYPFLGDKDIGDYYEEFMSSSASILLLIGPPGTGKTTFIRGLLQHCKISAIVSYDSAVLEKDYVFTNFIESDKSLLILEDADMFLKSRKEGNTMMHKFLNVGDGLVTTRGKKLIFSTNLPSINDIDSALIRPGRCYDILHFDELNQEQAEKLAEKIGTKLNEVRNKWSIADIFHERETNIRTFKKPVERKFGFV